MIRLSTTLQVLLFISFLGPAVWGVRAQIDRQLYKSKLQAELKHVENLTIREGVVEDLMVERLVANLS